VKLVPSVAAPLAGVRGTKQRVGFQPNNWGVCLNATVGPFLRWAGSKRKLLPELRSYWSPSYTRYVEPFMGSACLFFDLLPKRALLGDINSELVLCYEQVRLGPKSVYWHLSRFRADADSYYMLRSEDPLQMSAPRRAARLIYLTRFCFNGLYRTNQAGQFNVPHGGGRTGSLPTYGQLLAVSNNLASATFVCADFEVTIDQVQEGDFVYLDPPYWVEGKRRTNQYGPNTFCHRDLLRLGECLETINQRGAYFVLSYEDSEEANLLAGSWHTAKLPVRRNVAGFARNRRVALELVTTNISI
jgi:DNA adenine methylase